MGWFFGCFGCSSKKSRKHQAPVPPLPNQQQKRYSTLPPRVPLASSSAIPIKAFRDGANSEDLFNVRQVSSSAPVRHMQGAYLYDGGGGIRLPEKEHKPGPWYQLDDLEEELNELREQIERESQDAAKSTQEIHYLKSSGNLVKSPTKSKSSQQVDHQLSSVQESRWNSWLAPVVASSAARTPPDKSSQLVGLKVALCEPTPAKESHDSLPGVQTPVQSKNMRQSVMQHKMPTNDQEDGLTSDKKFDVHKCLISPARFQQKDQALPGPTCCNAVTNHPKDISGNLLKCPCQNANQSSWSLSDINGTQWTDATTNESASMKKRRLGVSANPAQSLHVMRQADNNNITRQDHNLLGQKRLKVASLGEQTDRQSESSFPQADPVPMHFFRCDSLSPIIESLASSDSEHDAEGPFEHQQTSYNSASQKTSQSPLLRQSPASEAKSVTFAGMNDKEYTTDEVSYSHGANYSGESYTNSTCINDANEEDSKTASYSPSTDSEETLSDLSPERCYSPPISPSHERKSTFYGSLNNWGCTKERQTARNISTQLSSLNWRAKKQHVSRYGSEEDKRSEDENELFTDAVSHVSTECSEQEYRKWHSRTESMDSVSALATDTIDTPPKKSDWVSTPNIDIQGKHASKVRSKPASSVLTPVENFSQLKQLKERDQKQTVVGKVDSDGFNKSHASKNVVKVCGTGTQNLKAEVEDENQVLSWTGNGHLTSQHNGSASVNTSFSHWTAAPGPEVVHVNVNASLSHWGITSTADAIEVEGSISKWGTTTNESDPVRVDMSLSHWLKSSSKPNEAQMAMGASSNSSPSGGGGVVRPAPQSDHQMSHIAKRTESTQTFMYAASERPILGATGGETCANAKPRSPWDGKGTPNATTKYKEDQRVKWHSTPFEQRLDKALDKQGILLQKKLFPGSK